MCVTEEREVERRKRQGKQVHVCGMCVWHSLVLRPCAFVACSSKFAQRAWLVHHVMCAAAYVMTLLLESMMS